jgi:hypothetical protein
MVTPCYLYMDDQWFWFESGVNEALGGWVEAVSESRSEESRSALAR